MTVFQRRDGRWVARVSVRGLRKDFYGRTREQVTRKATEYLQQLGLRPVPRPSRRTLQDVLQAYLASADLRPRTRADYEDVARRYLQPVLGVRLVDWDAQHVLVALAPLRTRPRTALKAYRLLHRLGVFAVRMGWVLENPSDRVDPPKYAPARRRVWTADELQRFLAEASRHRLAALFWVLACGGLRLGEALGLRWEDLDLAAGTVAVHRSLQRVGGRWVEQPPKTAAGQRTVHLPPQAVAVLRAHRRRALEEALRTGRPWSEEGLVFTAEGGRPLHRAQVLRAVKQLARRSGLPEEAARPHALRHLHASLLLASGAGLADVSRRLGHASTAVTAQVYSHAVRRDRELADLVARALRLGGAE